MAHGLPGSRLPSATPGFLPGPIEPGTWIAEVSLNYVLDGPPCTYHLHVSAEGGEPDGETEAVVTAARHTGDRSTLVCRRSAYAYAPLRWKWSVAELWQAVKQRELDFFVLTDHNTLSGMAEVAALETGICPANPWR